MMRDLIAKLLSALWPYELEYSARKEAGKRILREVTK